MSYTKDIYGKMKDGVVVDKITISNEEAKVSILTLGAIIESFEVKTKEGWRNIVVSSSTLDGYIDDPTYKSEVVAPYANRIKNGRFTLNGKSYQLDCNNGENNLHSGSANTGAKVWNVLFNTDNSVVMNVGHRDGDGGFPGNIGITVAYLLEGTSLTITYNIGTDMDTIVNPTNHAYFNLHGRDADIRDHVVVMNADRYVAADENLIPIAVKAVSGSDYDFTTPHALAERREGKYDTCFAFKEGEKPFSSISADNLTLTVETDRPAMQIYTGEFFSVADSPWGALGAFKGVALETSIYPDAPNNAEFPSPLLKAGEVLKTYTKYSVKVG